MKKQTLLKKLGHFRSYTDSKGVLVFESSANPRKVVKVYDRYGTDDKLALPCYVEPERQPLVVFHAKSVKSLVEFLERY